MIMPILVMVRAVLFLLFTSFSLLCFLLFALSKMTRYVMFSLEVGLPLCTVKLLKIGHYASFGRGK